MKDGGGSKNQTTTTTSAPPAYLQPYLQHGVEQSRSLYDQGPQEYYPGQTVVGFAPETEEALGLQGDRARAGSPVMAGANAYASSVLAGGGTPTFGMGSNPYSSSVYTPNSGYIGPINPYASSAYRPPSQPNPYAANTYSEAPNNYGAASNPALDAMFNKAADSTQTRLATEFAGSGRNIEASRPARAEELGNLATDFYGGAYENERNRGLEASQGAAGRGLSAYLQGQNIGATGYEAERGRMQEGGLLAQQIGANSFDANQGRTFEGGQADLARRQQAALAGQQIGASGYESERDRMAQELSQQRSQQLGVLGLAPQLAQSDYNDIDRLSQVGQTREDLTGRQYEDAASRYDFGQAAPGNSLDQYLARLQGYPGSAGSTSTPIYRNTAAGVAGGALAGYGIGNQFGYGGYGALLGGLLGYGGG